VKKLIIIPTYNERENISRLIKQIFATEISELAILVVDDNSPDGTAQHVQETFSDNVFILNRPEKKGLGKAYIDGFRWALKRDYDLIMQMDADLSHDPKYLKPMLDKIGEGADLVIGSRYVAGGGVKNWNWKRKLISKFGCLYARLILGISVKDITGGFKCFKREVLAKTPFEKLDSAGYSFQIETTYYASIQGFKITETPITFVDRTEGSSKMTMSIALEAFFIVLKLKYLTIRKLLP
jgi:dolichol-phosphate mannosyltransferase